VLPVGDISRKSLAITSQVPDVEQICNYVLRSLSKKVNAGAVPSWTITVYDGGEAGNKKAAKGQAQVSGTTYRIQYCHLLSNIG
jgi:hypothetical protein